MTPLEQESILTIALMAAFADGAKHDTERAEIKRTADIFRGQIVDVTSSVYTVQLAGTSDKLDAFIESVGEASILEVVRTGVSGIARGDNRNGVSTVTFFTLDPPSCE